MTAKFHYRTWYKTCPDELAQRHLQHVQNQRIRRVGRDPSGPSGPTSGLAEEDRTPPRVSSCAWEPCPNAPRALAALRLWRQSLILLQCVRTSTVQGILNPSTTLPLWCFPLICQSNLLQTTKTRETYVCSGHMGCCRIPGAHLMGKGLPDEPVFHASDITRHRGLPPLRPWGLYGAALPRPWGSNEAQPRALGRRLHPPPSSSIVSRERPSRPAGPPRRPPQRHRHSPGADCPHSPSPRGAVPGCPGPQCATEGLATPPGFPYGPCLGARAPGHLSRDTSKGCAGKCFWEAFEERDHGFLSRISPDGSEGKSLQTNKMVLAQAGSTEPRNPCAARLRALWNQGLTLEKSMCANPAVSRWNCCTSFLR